jgi:chemotaxis protein CheD
MQKRTLEETPIRACEAGAAVGLAAAPASGRRDEEIGRRTSPAVKHVVRAADARISDRPGDLIVTHALGSCLGVAAYDFTAGVGGILHVMLPVSRVNPGKAKVNPFLFVDTGFPAFLRKLFDRGAKIRRLVLKIAGGADLRNPSDDRLAIGRHNCEVLKDVFGKSGLRIDAEDIGGAKVRTLFMEIGSGRVRIIQGATERDL